MTTPIAPIGSIASLPGLAGSTAVANAGSVAGASSSGMTSLRAGSTAAADASSGLDFASVLADGIDQVAESQATADTLAAKAATGELVDPAQYTIAATKAQLMTQLATAIQSKAVQAFNTVMSMQA